METGAILIGLAQIGVALAGFTTIASVLVKTSQTTSRNLFIVRVLSVLLFGLTLILCALAPVLVGSAGFSDVRLWQISAILTMPIWGFCFLVGFFYLLPRVLRDKKNNWIQTIMITASGTAGFACSLAAIFSPQAEFFYMLSLMLIVTGCIVSITGLILSFPIFELFFVKKDAAGKNPELR